MIAAGSLLALGTLLALEGREVVVLRTRDPLGIWHESRTWVADYGGYAWIEAASEERNFYRHIVENPQVELVRHGQTGAYRAVAIETPEGHELIRRLLARKYGLADWWIGLLTDTSRSVAIRLEAAPRETPGGPPLPPPGFSSAAGGAELRR